MRILLLPAIFLFCGCIHSLSMHARDGQRFEGRYRFAAGDTGLIQVFGADDELLSGRFVRVSRSAFVEAFSRTFGQQAIVVYEPELSGLTPFAGALSSASALNDSAYGENFDRTRDGREIAVRGPLFYWTATLRGNRGSQMGCFLIGSNYTGHGFGRCRSEAGEDYSMEF